ncbi:MAG: hypothetical protein AAF311_15635 [Pseudomonadota bacterium]
MAKASSKLRRKQDQARPKGERERLRELMDVRAGKGRTKSGRKTYAERDDTKEAIMSVAMAQRIKLVGEKDARSARAETPLGVLRLKGAITEREYVAGAIYADIYERYLVAIGGQSPHAQSAAMGTVKGERQPLDADTVRARTSAWMAAHGLALQAGRHEASVVQSVCVERQATAEIDALRSGLSKLAGED